jgi:hypothetical protein
MFNMPVKSHYLDNLESSAKFTVGCRSLKAARVTSQSAFVRDAAADGRHG